MTQDNLLPPGRARQLMVVDPCAFGRAGLVAALSADLPAGAPTVIAGGTLTAVSQAWRGERQASGWLSGAESGCLVVRLPADPKAALALLLALGAPAGRAAFARCVTVLLTPHPPARVRWMLAATGGDLATRVVADGKPVAVLRRAVLTACGIGVRGDAGRGRNERTPRAVSAPTLSGRECRVLLLTLQEMPVAEMARRQAISHKTLYTQRLTAMRKLGVRGVHGLFAWLSGGPGGGVR